MSSCRKCYKFLPPQASFCSNCGLSKHGVLPQKEQSFEVEEAPSWPRFRKVLEIYFVLIGVHYFRYDHFESLTINLLSDVFLAIVIIYSVFVFFYRRKISIKKLLFPHIPDNYIVTSGILCLVALWGYYEFLDMLFPHGAIVKNIYSAPKANWSLSLAYLIPQLLCAELFFREILYKSLKQLVGFKRALLLQAIFFGAMYLSPILFVSYFVLGLFLGWVRERSGSLFYPILIHFFYIFFTMSIIV